MRVSDSVSDVWLFGGVQLNPIVCLVKACVSACGVASAVCELKCRDSCSVLVQSSSLFVAIQRAPHGSKACRLHSR